jgi:hypothetical protein
VQCKPLQAAEPIIEESQIKAALLFNFAKYIEWPPGTFDQESRPLTMCTIGQSDFTDAIPSLAGKQIKGHPVATRQISGAGDSQGCNILVFGNLERNLMQSVLDKAGNKVLLTVGDHNHFANSGGVVGFYSKDNKVRFEVNLAAAQKHKVKISSQVLKLARIVHGNEQ